MNFRQPTRRTKEPCQKRLYRRLSHRGSKWPGAIAALLAVTSTVAVSTQPARAQRDEVGEYELKAAILYNLSRFVEWPPSAYADSQAPTVLCVLGQDPFGDSLEMLGQKRDASGRTVSIRRLKNEDGIRECQMLYISTSQRKVLSQILSRLKGLSVLTVGEMSHFAVQGGIIQFTLEDKQVRFEINLDAASRTALKISSRLLMLARIVKEQARNPDSTSKLTANAPVISASTFFLPSSQPEMGSGGKRLSRLATSIDLGAGVGSGFQFQNDTCVPPRKPPPLSDFPPNCNSLIPQVSANHK